MKKCLFFLMLLLAGNTVFAQDYAPLPDTGIRRYFTNSAGYLRGIRVDSVVQEVGYKRYVTFRTARGVKSNYGNYFWELADSNGACWIGKNVRAYPNGDWHFPNQFNDTVIIKTGAKTGDSWSLYNDTTTLWFEAKVTSEDTQTVFGVLDSVKIITLTAKTGNTIVTSNPVNNWQLILSKSHGFATAADLYLFPYRDLQYTVLSPDPWYSMLQPDGNGFGTIVSSLLFRNMVEPVPANTQIFDFQPGDVMHYSAFDMRMNPQLSENTNDTVLTRQGFGSGIRYTINRWDWGNYYYSLNGHRITNLDIVNAGLYDTTYMPEEYRGTSYVRAYIYKTPSSPSWCGLTPDTAWEVCTGGGNGLRLNGNNIVEHSIFQEGLGMVAYKYIGLGEGLYATRYLKYIFKAGIPCGNPQEITSAVTNIASQNIVFQLYPQPAGTTVFLQAPQLRYPATIRIHNLQGQLLSTQELSAAGKPISTANLPAGLYLISVMDAGGNNRVEKLLVQR